MTNTRSPSTVTAVRPRRVLVPTSVAYFMAFAANRTTAATHITAPTPADAPVAA